MNSTVQYLLKGKNEVRDLEVWKSQFYTQKSHWNCTVIKSISVVAKLHTLLIYTSIINIRFQDYWDCTDDNNVVFAIRSFVFFLFTGSTVQSWWLNAGRTTFVSGIETTRSYMVIIIRNNFITCSECYKKVTPVEATVWANKKLLQV